MARHGPVALVQQERTIQHGQSARGEVFGDDDRAARGVAISADPHHHGRDDDGQSAEGADQLHHGAGTRQVRVVVQRESTWAEPQGDRRGLPGLQPAGKGDDGVALEHDRAKTRDTGWAQSMPVTFQ